MHRHVVAHGDDLAARVDHRAGIIAPLFDIGGERGAAQRRAHFFRNRVKQILENFDLDGIFHAVASSQKSAVSDDKSRRFRAAAE